MNVKERLDQIEKELFIMGVIDLSGCPFKGHGDLAEWLLNVTPLVVTRASIIVQFDARDRPETGFVGLVTTEPLSGANVERWQAAQREYAEDGWDYLTDLFRNESKLDFVNTRGE